MPTNSVPYTTIETAIRKYVDPISVDSITKTDPIIERIMSKNRKVHAGRSIQLPIEYALNPNVGTVQPYGFYDAAPHDPLTQMDLSWIHYYVPVTISEIEQAYNAGGVEKIIDITTLQIKNGMKSLMTAISEDLYGDGSPISNDGKVRQRITGLAGICTANAAYGGITPTTTQNTWWQPYELRLTSTTIPSTGASSGFDGAVASADLTLSTAPEYLPTVSRRVLEQINFGLDKCDLIACSPKVYSAWHKIFVSKQEIMNVAEVGKLGFTGLQWSGLQIVESKFCQDDAMFFINSDHLEPHILTGFDMKWTGFKDLPNQDAKQGRFPLSWNLAARARNRFGAVTGIPTYLGD